MVHKTNSDNKKMCSRRFPTRYKANAIVVLMWTQRKKSFSNTQKPRHCSLATAAALSTLATAKLSLTHCVKYNTLAKFSSAQMPNTPKNPSSLVENKNFYFCLMNFHLSRRHRTATAYP